MLAQHRLFALEAAPRRVYMSFSKHQTALSDTGLDRFYLGACGHGLHVVSMQSLAWRPTALRCSFQAAISHGALRTSETRECMCSRRGRPGRRVNNFVSLMAFRMSA